MNKQFWCDHTGPFVETVAGTVRGYKLNDLYIFHGIKYADAKRFEMPTPVKHHDGIEDAFTYGPVAPTIMKPSVGPSSCVALDPCFRYNFWPEDENCQYLNVWTRSINSNDRKPVMVWCHGGGFSNGSSIEQHSYDPSNLASENDVVVVSFNHRLNILGFLDMSDYSDRWYESRNVGMADIVEALKWVQENIKNFGGDPDNVTLFGQSGGGGKIQTLLQMPAAYGLFHKAIIQSGASYPEHDEDKKVTDGKKLAEAVVCELGLNKDNVEKITDVPFSELREAFLRAQPKLIAEGIEVGFGPVRDDYFLGTPLTSGYSEKFLSTPILAGTVQCEQYHFAEDFSDYQGTEQYKYNRVKSLFGEHTNEMIDLFKSAYPDDDILNLYHMDWFFRRGTIDMLDGIIEHNGSAKCYSYVIDYNFRFLGGMPSYHGADLPFVFNNTDIVLACNEPAAKKLGEQISRCWANFARYGNPNHEFIEKWEAYENNNRVTMILGDKNHSGADIDRELIMKHFEYLGYKDLIELFVNFKPV